MFRCPVRLPYIGLVHMLWWALFGLQCAWVVRSGHCLVCMDCAVHINLLGTSQSPASCSVHTGVPSCPATASHPEWNWFSSNLHTVITFLSQQAFATISCQISTRETQVHYVHMAKIHPTYLLWESRNIYSIYPGSPVYCGEEGGRGIRSWTNCSHGMLPYKILNLGAEILVAE